MSRNLLRTRLDANTLPPLRSNEWFGDVPEGADPLAEDYLPAIRFVRCSLAILGATLRGHAPPGYVHLLHGDPPHRQFVDIQMSNATSTNNEALDHESTDSERANRNCAHRHCTDCQCADGHRARRVRPDPAYPHCPRTDGFGVFSAAREPPLGRCRLPQRLIRALCCLNMFFVHAETICL
jgi:hypothetical protein